VADLQRALSDSHVYLWEERERVQKLQAENNELKIQEVEDRRRIQARPARMASTVCGWQRLTRACAARSTCSRSWSR
jgi:hypothetical protein